MFWRVVGHMNNTQRQQLLYFATGSASLPSSSDEEQCKIIMNTDILLWHNACTTLLCTVCHNY